MDDIIYILETISLFEHPTGVDIVNKLNILSKLAGIKTDNPTASIDILIYSVQYLQTFQQKDICNIVNSSFDKSSMSYLEQQLLIYILGRIYIMRKTSIFAVVRPMFNGYNSKELIGIIQSYADKLLRICSVPAAKI